MDAPVTADEDVAGGHTIYARAPRSGEFNKLRKRLVRLTRQALDDFSMVVPGQRWLVALSGGPDSLCLAHLLWTKQVPLRLEILAAHLDHGIRSSSVDEATVVRRICEEWGVPCYTRRRDVPTLASREGVSLEVAARRARYGYLAEVARQHGCRVIALAHHADDQVETVLWRLIRGAGTGGLRGIRPVAPLDPDLDSGAACGQSPLTLLRPLLPVTRDQIEAYCRLHGLAPVTDASNADETIPRNWLRHTVVPMLRSRAPHLAASVGRTAEVLSAEDELLQSLTEQAWQSCDKELVEGAVRLGLASLQSQHPALLRRMLRRAYALVAGSLRDLGWQHVHDLERLIDEGGVGATVSLPGALQAALGYHWLTIGRGDGFAPRWRPRMAAGEVAEVAWPGRWRSPRADWRLTMRLISSSVILSRSRLFSPCSFSASASRCSSSAWSLGSSPYFSSAALPRS